MVQFHRYFYNVVLFLFYNANLFSQEIEKKDSLKNSERESSFSLGIGGSVLLAPADTGIPQEFYPLYQQLRSGFCLNGNYRFRIKKNFGIGAKYALFRSHGNLSLRDKSGLLEISETITTHYVAPAIFAVLSVKKTNPFVSISVPFILYDDFSSIRFTDTKGNVYAVYEPTFKGRTAGLAFDFGNEFDIGKKNYFGINVSFLAAILRQMELQDPISNIIIEEPNNISRVDITLYLRLM